MGAVQENTKMQTMIIDEAGRCGIERVYGDPRDALGAVAHFVHQRADSVVLDRECRRFIVTGWFIDHKQALQAAERD